VNARVERFTNGLWSLMRLCGHVEYLWTAVASAVALMYMYMYVFVCRCQEMYIWTYYDIRILHHALLCVYVRTTLHMCVLHLMLFHVYACVLHYIKLFAFELSLRPRSTDRSCVYFALGAVHKCCNFYV